MRLVIISLDAAFAADADTLLSLPHLGALAAGGVFCDRVQTIYPSLTYPIHVSLVTGAYPEAHGIAHNQPFQPEVQPRMRRWHWDAADIKVDTLFTAAHRAGRVSAAILWPVTGHSRAIRYNFPEVLALPGESQVLKVLRYGSTGWLLKNELLYGRRRVSTKQPHLDDYTTLIAQKLIARHPAPTRGKQGQELVMPTARALRRHMPDLLALHLVDLDAMRHAHGVFSAQAQEAMQRLDQRVGRVVRALEEKDLLRDTIIAVVSDHGQADLTGSLPLDAWLRANQVPARAQTLGLGAYIRLNRADYRPVLETLRAHQASLHLKHIYTREELRGMRAQEDILLAVEPEEGIAIVDDENQPPGVATHGFRPDHPASQALLFLSGPPFKKGHRLSGCNLVDIAPTLAAAAGLSLPQAQGRVLWEAMNGLEPPGKEGNGS